MPATLTLAATASLLLLVRSVKQPREALSHTDNRSRTSERAGQFVRSAPERRA